MTERSRFDHLERARPEASAESPRVGDASRFGAVEQARAETAPQASGVAEGRFRPPEERYELDTGDHGLSFLRCAACRVDNNRFATRCAQCGSAFDTPEQRAFNDALAQELQAQRQTEQAEAAAREQARAEEAVREAQQQRRLGELLAAEVGARERARFGGDDGVPAALADKPSLAMWLLGKIPDARLRWSVGCAVALAPVIALVRATPRTPGMSRAIALLLLVVVAFLPPRILLSTRRARWSRWTGWGE